MKKHITYLVAVFFAMTVVGLADDKDAIEAKEKAAWQAFKDKKADDFKKILDQGYRGVFDEGIFNQADEVAGMAKWDMKSFALSDFTSYSDTPDVIVTTYKVAIQGTISGEDVSGTYNCGTVWKAEKGVWLALFHTNVKAEK